MRLQAAHRLIATAEFEFDPHAHWKFGSNIVPASQKGGFHPSPFPRNEHSLSLLKPTYYNAKPLGTYLVPVEQLTSWQDGVDPSKLRPLENPHNYHSFPPIEVSQILDKLVIFQGNHRAADAYIQGIEFIPAIITNFDDPKNAKFRKDKPVQSFELSKHVRKM